MRAIAGLIHFDSRPAALDALRRMTTAMAIGASDRIAHDSLGGAALAHLLKNSFPEDAFEAQPVRSADGHVLLVTDATLNNRAELAAAFGWSAAAAASRADGAFVLAAVEKWGDAAPTRLGGTFALAAWFARERRLFIATDPHGCRPFYYRHDGATFLFSSTLRGILAAPGVSRALDETTLTNLTVGGGDSPTATLYRDVARLPGGLTLTVDATGARTSRHWNPDATRVLTLGSDADYAAAFRAEFTGAVQRTIARTKGNVGILVSGGLDSVAVTMLAGELLAAEGRRLQAIHIVPAPGGRYAAPLRELDESRHVRALQAHAPHIDFHFVRSASTPEPVATWEEYLEDNQVPVRSLPSRDDGELLPLLDRLGVELLLDGQGGNFLVSPEALAGRYLESLAVSGQPLAWWRAARGHSRIYGWTLRQLARHTAVNPLKRLVRGRPRVVLPSDHSLWMLTPAARTRTGIEARVRAQEAQQLFPVRDYRRYLHYLLTDMSAQQRGLATSVIHRETISRRGGGPMFDLRFNEFCLALPFEQQFRDGWDRRLLREFLRGRVPEEVRLRVTRGYAQPEFQSNFTRAEPDLRAEFERLATCDAAREWIDFEWVRRHWDTPPAKATWGRELTLVGAVALGHFLRWHARQA
ncbi:MAG: hypothetical protein RLZZ15_2104 [Verrucomicrobiota bacterium]